jgi:hypothetical protein
LELTSEENQKKLEEEHLALLDKIKKTRRSRGRS